MIHYGWCSISNHRGVPVDLQCLLGTLCVGAEFMSSDRYTASSEALHKRNADRD